MRLGQDSQDVKEIRYHDTILYITEGLDWGL